MEDQDKRIEQLELKITHMDTMLSSVTICCANLINQIQRLQEDSVNLIADVEADGNTTAEITTNLRQYMSRLTKFTHALDAKNTALATIVCREMGLDPDVMLREYGRVLSDFGSVQQLIDTTKGEPDSN
jgi:hypothetical protein